MYKVLVMAVMVVFAIASLVGCAEPASGDIASGDVTGSTTTEAVAQEDQLEFVWVACASSLPMFVENDFVALDQFAEEYNVTVSHVGPSDYDIAAMIASIQEVAATNPDGLIIPGFDDALETVINDCMEMGIPVVCVDGDVASSNRLCFVGTDWYQVGIAHAEQMIKFLGEEGKVAFLCHDIGSSLAMDTYDGYQSIMNQYPGIEIVDVYQTDSSVEKAATLTYDIMSAYPDIAGITVIDGSTSGVGSAVKEAGKAGQIVLTGMNLDTAQLKLLQEDVFSALIGQKRKLFTYYGAQMLYDYITSPVTITTDDTAMGITKIPVSIDTGIFVVDQSNIDIYLQGETLE